MLTTEEKEFIKSKILDKIKIVESDIAFLKKATEPIAPDNSIGRITRMDAINNKSVAEQSLRQALDKIGKLKESLIKIDSEDFGKCQKCNGDIDFKRIAFMPEIRRCMKCAR